MEKHVYFKQHVSSDVHMLSCYFLFFLIVSLLSDSFMSACNDLSKKQKHIFIFVKVPPDILPL